MRMHRGSSKGGPGRSAPPETLPLSAPLGPVEVTVEVGRAGRTVLRTVVLARGRPVSDAVREVGEAPEGCAVLVDGTSIPLDTPVEGPLRITVLPVFSGG
jgi:sulfur carrier protein ThiS